MNTYDVIVVGLGAMGSSAAYHLARRGQRVLGLDAFSPPHTLGSSHGESRIIRMAYLEHPDYVPLLHRAYELWRELERESGRELLCITGGLFVGPPESEVVAGSLESARVHGLEHRLLDADDVRREYPALNPGDSEVAVYESPAGILFPERCIETHLELAARHCADLRYGTRVLGWSATRDSVDVETSEGRYTAQSAVFAAGAWTSKLLPDLGTFLRPERVFVFWLEPHRPELFDPSRFPIYIWDAGEPGIYYGFPHLELTGAKVGRHHSGEWCDPDTLVRETTPEDEARVRAFVQRCIPALDGPVLSSSVCIYTDTPDEHFLVDRHPEYPSVVYAAGFSGHGFKFSSVMGEVLADLALDGGATPHAEFLRAARFR